MMAGGSDRVAKVAGTARRPAIRPKPVTPPRTASLVPTPTHTLPPVRTPARRLVKRPVLLLVDLEDMLDHVASTPPAFVVTPRWKQPFAIALAVASVLVATITTAAVVWTASARRDAAEATESVGTTTLASATLSLPPTPPVVTTTTAAVASAAIPVVDVSSLPSVPGRSASGASR